MLRWLLCIRCLTPMVHNAGTVRNRTYVNRQSFAGDGRLSRVPIISANSLRHNLLREPLGLDLIDRYNLKEQLTKPQLRLLTAGGNQASEKGGRIDLQDEQKLRRAIPAISLLGAGLPTGPIESRITVSDGVLLCRESLPIVSMIAPELDLPRSMWSAIQLVADAQHFAPDPSHKLGFALDEKSKLDEFDDNIFAGEYVIPGSVFLVEITANRLSDAEQSAIKYGLDLWATGGGLLGGKQAHGRGRTECMVFGELPDSQVYFDESQAQKPQAMDWLAQLGGSQKSKPKARGKRQSATLLDDECDDE